MTERSNIPTLLACRDELERRAALALHDRWLWRIKADTVSGWINVMRARGRVGVEPPGGAAPLADAERARALADHPILSERHRSDDPPTAHPLAVGWREQARDAYRKLSEVLRAARRDLDRRRAR